MVAAGPRPPWYAAWAPAWYQLSLAAAAGLSVPVASAADRLIRHLGGYRTASLWFGVQSLHEIKRGLPLIGRSVLALFGADYGSVTGAGNIAFAFAHLPGVIAVVVALLVAAWHFLRPARARLAGAGQAGAADPAGDLVANILVLAIVANVAAYIALVPIENIYSAHEMGPVLAFGAALAGRTLGPWVVRSRVPASPVTGAAASGSGDADGQVAARGPLPSAGQVPSAGPLPATGPASTAAPLPAVGSPPVAGPPPAAARVRRGMVSVLAAGVALYAVLLGIATAHPQVPPRNVGLAAFLAKHHLNSGLSAYWEASSVTVDSGGQITMLAVVPKGWHQHFVPYHWQNDLNLAEQSNHFANFVVISPAERITPARALASFGKPARTYRWGPFSIWVYRKNLLGPLALGASPPRHRSA